MKVKDIMTKKVISVKQNDSIMEVSELLTKFKIHGVPVLHKNKIVGIITEVDFFIKSMPDIFLPSYIKILKKTKMKKGGVSMKRKREMKKIMKAKAEDIMTKNCITIYDNADISELIKLFQMRGIYTIPVLNRSGKMVGIVSQADIIKLIK